VKAKFQKQSFEGSKMSLNPFSVIVRYFEQGDTINNKTFKSNCLYPLLNALNKQRQTSGMKNIKIHYDNARPHLHFSVKK
jgi:hypothetical protein